MSADADGVDDIRSQGLGGWVVDEGDAGCPELLDLVRSLGGRGDLRMVLLRTALRSAGRFYKTALNGLLQRINSYLVRWAKRKYKRLRSFKKVRRWRKGLTARQPRLFAHWAWMTDFKYSL